MSTKPIEGEAEFRRQLYLVIVLVALAGVAGRLMTFRTPNVKDRPTPFLSANDRSRWCTIASLVDQGTYAIDEFAFDPETGKRRAGWHTIDMVRHRGPDGRDHYYSSKPVLMPTLLAGVYAVVKAITGTTLLSHPFYVGNIVTAIANFPALLAIALCLAWWLETYGTTNWGRLTVMVCAAFGTFLTTFAICLNNHLHGAAFTMAALTFAQQIREVDRAPSWKHAAAGLCAAMAFANELPALAFLVAIFVLLWLKDWRGTCVGFVPAASVVLAAMVGLNWYAHGDLRPPYVHRNVGAKIASLGVTSGAFAATSADEQRAAIEKAAPNATLPEGWTLLPARKAGRWVVADAQRDRRLAIALESDTPASLPVKLARALGIAQAPDPTAPLAVFEWDDWYDYEGTYWTDENVQGVDQGEKSVAVYAFHVLVGHHGLFSLSPFWALSILGGMMALRARDSLAWPAILGFLLTGACLFFFVLVVRMEDRNYGGMTNGLRWLFWLIPIWLVMAIPAVDHLAKSRWGRGLVVALLLVNIFSVSYGPLNPWSHPWLFHYWEQLGWIRYE